MVHAHCTTHISGLFSLKIWKQCKYKERWSGLEGRRVSSKTGSKTICFPSWQINDFFDKKQRVNLCLWPYLALYQIGRNSNTHFFRYLLRHIELCICHGNNGVTGGTGSILVVGGTGKKKRRGHSKGDTKDVDIGQTHILVTYKIKCPSPPHPTPMPLKRPLDGRDQNKLSCEK